MERRLGVLAGALIALAAGAHGLAAAPTTAAAKAAFAEGVAHYQRGEWESASGAFASAYALEPDADALFAWAQAERKLGHCAKAVGLYDKLLALPALPTANARAITASRAECTALLAKAAHGSPPRSPVASTSTSPRSPATLTSPPRSPATSTPPPRAPATSTAPPRSPTTSSPTSTPPALSTSSQTSPVEPLPVELSAAELGAPAAGDAPVSGGPRPEARGPADAPAGASAFFGDGLALTGLVALGAGTAVYLAGRSADAAKGSAATYGAFRADEDRAHRDGRIGTGMMIGGAALLAGGIVWFATHRAHVTVDAAPTAVALRGTF